MNTIAVLGGGNIGMAICAVAKLQGGAVVRLVTSKKRLFGERIRLIHHETGEARDAVPDLITDSYGEGLENADFVIVAYPSFMIEQTFKAIARYLKPFSTVCVVPGSGGIEFFADSLPETVRLFGVDRVPFVSRIVEPGVSVCYSPKTSVRGCCLQSPYTKELCAYWERAIGTKCEPLACYMTVTLTPSNPLMHPSRLYTRFRDWHPGQYEPSNFWFYREWGDDASKILLACDDELKRIVGAYAMLPLQVVPLREHYEAPDARAMTRKLLSIPSLKDISGPMTERPEGFALDLDSRCFLEDMPFGLCIIQGFAGIAGVETPTIDRLIQWYERIELLGNPQRFPTPDALRDLAVTPQRYGIHTLDDVARLYR